MTGPVQGGGTAPQRTSWQNTRGQRVQQGFENKPGASDPRNVSGAINRDLIDMRNNYAGQLADKNNELAPQAINQYKIKSGDTVSDIVNAIRTQYGVTDSDAQIIKELQKANPNLKNPNLIRAGDTLNLGKYGEVATRQAGQYYRDVNRQAESEAAQQAPPTPAAQPAAARPAPQPAPSSGGMPEVDAMGNSTGRGVIGDTPAASPQAQQGGGIGAFLGRLFRGGDRSQMPPTPATPQAMHPLGAD